MPSVCPCFVRPVVGCAVLAAVVASTAAERTNRAAATPIPRITEPLPTLLQRGTNAFTAGDYPAAASAFADVQRDYAGEEAWKSGQLPRRLLPLKGFAELQAGLASDASESLATFLEQFPDDQHQRGFALYTLALALRQSGDRETAIEKFAIYEQENAGTAQAALAGFQRAELLFEAGRSDDAFSTLDTLAVAASTDSLRTQARLRALRKAVELRNDDHAATQLLDRPWSVETMPEIAVLAFAAMEIGDRALAAGRAAEAVRAYRLVLPKQRLVLAQRERLAAMRERFEQRASTLSAAGNATFWVEFYRARIEQITAELQALEATEDFTAPLRLRLGQAFLLAGRAREAWLAFEQIALDPEAAPRLRAEAHYRWILAAAEILAWDEALVIAREFTERFPEAELAPEAFYLIARAHLEQRRHAEAGEVLSDILTRFPGAACAERARFTRGWVRTMLERFGEARDDFDRYAVDHPKGGLVVNAALWRALTFFFEHRYPEALEALDHLASVHRNHPLGGEILYRRGTTLYAMRELGRARTAIEEFLAAHPQHQRRTEASVLLGDILMGAGELDAARRIFAEVDRSEAQSFVYGAFQIGKILRAQNDFAGMIEHFRSYVAEDDQPPLPRVSEALYWIGWAEEQRGRAVDALPVFLDVLDRFGDDPHAGEVGTTLQALSRLVQRLHVTGGDGATSRDARTAALLAGDFDTWIEAERRRALTAKQLTRLARFTLFAADRHAARKEPHQEEALLLQLAGQAPVEALDAPALARVGLVLQDVGSPECRRYFEELLRRFPSRMERGAAFFGLAGEAVKERHVDDALRWLERFENETPTHPLAPRAALLAAAALEQGGRLDEAARRFEDLLRLKSARGRPHAEALMGLARCATASGDAKRAVAFCQRVFTLHRAQSDLAAEAYLRSGSLFEALGDTTAAAGTYREMLALADIGSPSQREQARRALDTLLSREPPEAQPESAAPAATSS